MSTKPPSRTAEQFVVRLPEGMRDRIAELAKQNGRSMNAEIVQRLEWALKLDGPPTFELKPASTHPPESELTWYLTTLIKDLAEQNGVAYDEMLAKIFVAGLNPDAPQVLYAPILPGATMEEFRTAMKASEGIVRPDAAIVTERIQGSSWSPPWVVHRLAALAKAAITSGAKSAQPRITRKVTKGT